MKEYEDIPESSSQMMVSDVAVEYEVEYEIAQPQLYPTVTREFKIPRDEYGNPIGYTLDEVFDGVDHNLSEFYGVDFMKLTLMLN
jgi:hypothetical protein